jgi:hypothetical protein
MQLPVSTIRLILILSIAASWAGSGDAGAAKAQDVFNSNPARSAAGWDRWDQCAHSINNAIQAFNVVDEANATCAGHDESPGCWPPLDAALQEVQAAASIFKRRGPAGEGNAHNHQAGADLIAAGECRTGASQSGSAGDKRNSPPRLNGRLTATGTPAAPKPGPLQRQEPKLDPSATATPQPQPLQPQEAKLDPAAGGSDNGAPQKGNIQIFKPTPAWDRWHLAVFNALAPLMKTSECAGVPNVTYRIAANSDGNSTYLFSVYAGNPGCEGVLKRVVISLPGFPDDQCRQVDMSALVLKGENGRVDVNWRPDNCL